MPPSSICGEESCIPLVAEEFPKNDLVHVAYPGLADRNESWQSTFALSDGDFAIERIVCCNVEDPEFTYLSACHTTVGDETIHLASAMQFVGFRSVIGTMWAVDDGETNEIMPTFCSLVKNASGRLGYPRATYTLDQTMRTINVPIDQRVLISSLGSLCQEVTS